MREPFESRLRRALCLAAAAGLVGACTGPDGSISEPDDLSVVAPHVTLQVRLSRDDLPFEDDSTSIAHGEAVGLRWETGGPAERCTASGRWAGSPVGARGGRTTSGSLPGPATYRFEVACENRAGSASDGVTVRVAAPGERPPRSDRPDEVDGHHVKVLLVLPAEGEGRDLDTGGWLARDVDAFQSWLASETASEAYPQGRRFRMDLFEGELDIARIRLHRTAAELAGLQRQILLDLVTARIDEIGFTREETKYLAYFDGPTGGSIAGVDALVGISTKADLVNVIGTSPLAVHQLAHTHGIVDGDAPHVEHTAIGGHVTDSRYDLMHGSFGLYRFGVVLDRGRDDYYSESGLSRGIDNFANSPYLVPAGPGASAAARGDLLGGQAEQRRRLHAHHAEHQVELAPVMDLVLDQGAEPLPRP